MYDKTSSTCPSKHRLDQYQELEFTRVHRQSPHMLSQRRCCHRVGCHGCFCLHPIVIMQVCERRVALWCVTASYLLLAILFPAVVARTPPTFSLGAMRYAYRRPILTITVRGGATSFAFPYFSSSPHRSTPFYTSFFVLIFFFLPVKSSYNRAACSYGVTGDVSELPQANRNAKCMSFCKRQKVQSFRPKMHNNSSFG